MTLKNSKTLLTVSLTLLLCSMFGATFLYRALENLAQGQKNSWPSFRLETSGKFSSVFRFPLLLENLPYEISFEEINITKSGDLKEPWNAVYAIKLLSYEF